MIVVSEMDGYFYFVDMITMNISQAKSDNQQHYKYLQNATREPQNSEKVRLRI